MMYHVSQSHHMKIEQQPQATCTKIWWSSAKDRDIGFWDMRADIQTNRQTGTHITILCTPNPGGQSRTQISTLHNATNTSTYRYRPKIDRLCIT